MEIRRKSTGNSKVILTKPKEVRNSYSKYVLDWGRDYTLYSTIWLYISSAKKLPDM